MFDDATKAVIDFFLAHPSLRYAAAFMVVAWFVRNILKGAYPTGQGVPPRWVSGLVLALAPFSLIVRAIGKWVASKVSWLGFNFDETTGTGKILNLPEKPPTDPRK